MGHGSYCNQITVEGNSLLASLRFYFVNIMWFVHVRICDKLSIANSTWFISFECLIYGLRIEDVGFNIALICVIGVFIIIEIGLVLCMKKELEI